MGPLDARLLLWYAKISAPQAMMVSTTVVVLGYLAAVVEVSEPS